MKEQALKPALVGCFNRLVAFPALDGTWQLNRLFVCGGFIINVRFSHVSLSASVTVI